MSLIRRIGYVFLAAVSLLFISCNKVDTATVVFMPDSNTAEAVRTSLDGRCFIFEVYLHGDKYINEMKSCTYRGDNESVKFTDINSGKLEVYARIFASDDEEKNTLWRGYSWFDVSSDKNTFTIYMTKIEEETVDEIENKPGTKTGNFISDGNADGLEAAEQPSLFFSCTENCSFSVVDGGCTGKCWKVIKEKTKRNFNQEFFVDFTPIYGRGKSYHISFKLKGDFDSGTNKSIGEKFNVNYIVYSGEDKKEADLFGYDLFYPENLYYVYPREDMFSTDEVFEKFLNVTLDTKIDCISDRWAEYNFVIPASEIDSIVNGLGLYKFYFTMGAGAMYGSNGAGYSYLIDDFCVTDLNSELERTGSNWADFIDSDS